MAAGAPPIYEKARSDLARDWRFFEIDRAGGFWTELRTLTELEQAWAVCEGNEAFKYWNNVWFDDDLMHTRADLVLKNDLQRYGENGVRLVQAELETVKYCHDLLRTYETWDRTYMRAKVNPARELWEGPDYNNISEPFNAWDRHCWAMRLVKYFNQNVCNDLPDWRSPQEVANYDTALVNNTIGNASNPLHNQAQRAASRQVVEDYLSNHGDTLSDADRAALEEIIRQLQ